jgi:hypothetical protein
MEVIDSISNIKTIENFPNSQEYKKYLLTSYRNIISRLSLMADEVIEYKKIQEVLLKNINIYSEDNTNNEIIVNDHVPEEDIEISEPTEEKPKTKKSTKKTETVTVSEDQPTEDKPKTKKSTKKTEPVSEDQPTEEKPKTKKSTKKTETVTATTVASEDQPTEDKPKTKKTVVTKKTETEPVSEDQPTEDKPKTKKTTKKTETVSEDKPKTKKTTKKTEA